MSSNNGTILTKKIMIQKQALKSIRILSNSITDFMNTQKRQSWKNLEYNLDHKTNDRKFYQLYQTSRTTEITLSQCMNSY